MRVEDRAGPAPYLVCGQRQHQAAGRGVPGQRGHGELAGVGQDRLHQVVDGVDVLPGLRGGVGGGLDHVQVDAVAEEVPGRAEHDHLGRARLGVPVGGQQAPALAGAHRPAGEAELQVADRAGLAVADLPVGAPGPAAASAARGPRVRRPVTAPSARVAGSLKVPGPPGAGRRRSCGSRPRRPRWRGRSRRPGGPGSSRAGRAARLRGARRTGSTPGRRARPARRGWSRPRAAWPAPPRCARPASRSRDRAGGTADATAR